MKAVTVSQFGSPDVLRFGDVPDPRPEADSVVVAVEAVGLGSMDAAARRGGSYFAPEPGFIPGYEIAGTVIEAGTNAAKSWLGSRVFAVLRTGGGCAERVEITQDQLIHLPDAISCEAAVGTGLNALVAQVGLSRIPIANTSKLLVRGAGSGIGLMAVQFGALRTAAIAATTSSKQRGERLRALGASSIWDRTTAGQDGSEAFDIIVDTVIGEEFPAFFDRLANNGHYMMCGGLGGLPPSDFGMKLLEHFHKSPTLYAFSLNSASFEDVAREAATLFDHIEAGRIAPVIDCVLPLSGAIEAHRKLDAGEAFGKIILKPDGTA